MEIGEDWESVKLLSRRKSEPRKSKASVLLAELSNSEGKKKTTLSQHSPYSIVDTSNLTQSRIMEGGCASTASRKCRSSKLREQSPERAKPNYS